MATVSGHLAPAASASPLLPGKLGNKENTLARDPCLRIDTGNRFFLPSYFPNRVRARRRRLQDERTGRMERPVDNLIEPDL